jgi:hypothetical protein
MTGRFESMVPRGHVLAANGSPREVIAAAAIAAVPVGSTSRHLLSRAGTRSVAPI